MIYLAGNYQRKMNSQSTEQSTAKGVMAALVSFFFLSLIGVFVKLSVAEGAKLWWIVFIQYSTAFALAIVISAKDKFRSLKSQNYTFEFLRGGAGLLSFLCFAFAMTEIPLVDASLLQNTAPIFIPIIALFWLKDVIEKRIWIGVTIGFVGIILIIKPDETTFNSGDLIGLLSGALLGFAYVAMKILTKTDGFKTILFYFSLTAFVISLPLGIIYWSTPGIYGWLFAIGSGVSFVSYLNLQQVAYKHIEPNKLSPFNYSVVVFTGLLDWWIFNHVPGLLTIAGIAIVCLGGILAVVHHEKKVEDLKHSWH
jgi:drug/metabolite transporter (DMT)-like permease